MFNISMLLILLVHCPADEVLSCLTSVHVYDNWEVKHGDNIDQDTRNILIQVVQCRLNVRYMVWWQIIVLKYELQMFVIMPTAGH